MRYRGDIDGLRAVAVLTVLFYHLGFTRFAGGFIGVDVFFVISGFLMTQIVATERAAGHFSFTSFYARRARRILPALFIVILATYIAGAMIFLPVDFARLSASTLAAVFGLSNITFWNENGYFDVEASLKPLLHTWSLAVELQFYLVWPLLLLIFMSYRKLSLGIAVTGLVSFIACWQIMKTDQSAAFFLTPFRIFEFALGGVIVVLPMLNWRGVAIEAIYATGLAAILFAVFTYDNLTVFPGATALLPCIGAAMALYAGADAKSSKLLRLPFTVWIGKISYSLYLIHWPIIVFYLYVRDRPPTLLGQIILLCAALAVATVSYYFVETPMRKPMKRRRHYGAIASVMLGLVGISIQSWATGGWTWRYPVDLQAISSVDATASKVYIWANHAARQPEGFSTTKPRLLVIGDSQAADITNLLVEGGYENDYEIVTRTIHTQCGLPYIAKQNAMVFWKTKDPSTVKDPSFIPLCEGYFDGLINSPALGQADIVLAAYLWQDYSVPLFDDFLREMRARTKAPIYVFGNKYLDLWPEQMVAKLGGIEGFASYAYDTRNKSGLSVNQALLKKAGRNYVDIMGAICPDRTGCLMLTGKNIPVYWDTGHLTKEGVVFLAGRIGKKLFNFLPPAHISALEQASKTSPGARPEVTY